MGLFRKRPVEVEAYCYNQERGNFRPDWFQDAVTDNRIVTYPDCAYVRTLEGEMLVSLGDWVIKGIEGELYPCKPDIFAATYDEVSQSGE
jgi:hypothetical protein